MVYIEQLGVRKKDFEDYVNAFSKKHGLTQEEAMKQKIVQEVYEYYLEDSKGKE